MSKPHIIDPDSVQLAPMSKYLGKGRGNGVLNDWNPLESGLMRAPKWRSASFGGGSPSALLQWQKWKGCTCTFGCTWNQIKFPGCSPRTSDTRVNTASTFPAMSFPSLISVGTQPDRVCRVETKIKPFPVLPSWKRNSSEFSNFLLCNFKDCSTPAWGHQGKVFKFPKGIFFF